MNCPNPKSYVPVWLLTSTRAPGDAVTERDLWIVSDGTRVDCYVLTGLRFQQAASVRVRWDVKKREPAELSVEALADCVARVTEGSVTLQED